MREHDEHETTPLRGESVRFTRRDDGAIIASTTVYPWSEDFPLFDQLERESRRVTRHGTEPGSLSE